MTLLKHDEVPARINRVLYPDSSFIRKARYSTKDEVLILDFEGAYGDSPRTYAYKNVDYAEWLDLDNEDASEGSVGAFYNSCVKGYFPIVPLDKVRILDANDPLPKREPANKFKVGDIVRSTFADRLAVVTSTKTTGFGGEIRVRWDGNEEEDSHFFLEEGFTKA